MNERRTRFVQEFLVDRNGTAAAVRAGYSRRTAASIAHELLTKPDVADAVREGEAELAAAAQVTREDVLHGLLEAVATARVKCDPAAQIAGWREIGKMCGFYVPERQRVEVSVNGSRLMTKLQEMPDAELFVLATEP